MCKICNGITSINERIANHNFMEQMRDYYGLGEKPLKDNHNKRKDSRKSVIARIECQLQRLQERLNDAGYREVHQNLTSLLDRDFDDAFVNRYHEIMQDYNSLLKAEVLAYFKD